ncbi:hypothetical protein LINGRAHAP2_LOCUS34931, partial [Linum grandiflorum]
MNWRGNVVCCFCCAVSTAAAGICCCYCYWNLLLLLEFAVVWFMLFTIWIIKFHLNSVLNMDGLSLVSIQ